jgi:hypothetical protein
MSAEHVSHPLRTDDRLPNKGDFHPVVLHTESGDTKTTVQGFDDGVYLVQCDVHQFGDQVDRDGPADRTEQLANPSDEIGIRVG